MVEQWSCPRLILISPLGEYRRVDDALLIRPLVLM